ncbi:hypothetical protein DQ04_00641000 [Trypanosoma grayi]|uniref:hypothetical protein n=1 Tax=Trypanosoma grayi TaxID=71804 RepID=UPI0004F4AD41|nr:hypothetical protein DQ04_00641000 [Trypanosoma grayi]KEG14056.1 hypothetical protein DQ04_00641000 [Trypanosoma grayi]
MLADRFSHLRVYDSDSDSDIPQRFRQPSGGPLPGTMDAVKEKGPMTPVGGISNKPDTQQAVTSTKEKSASQLQATPSERQPVNMPAGTALPEGQSVSQLRATAPRSEGASLIASGNSSAVRFPEKKGASKKQSTSTTETEKVKPHRETSTLVVAPIRPSGVADESSTPAPLLGSSKETGTVEEIRLQSNKSTENEREVQVRCEKQVTPTSGRTQAGASKDESRGNRGAPVHETQPPPTRTATNPTTKETKGIISKKYWEDTYGYDPSKRGLPLFVAVEHCPPKKILARSDLRRPDSLPSKTAVPIGTASNQNQSMKKNVYTTEEVVPAIEESAVTDHDSRLLVEEHQVGESPQLNENDGALLKDEDAAKLLSNTEPSESAELDQKHRRHQRKGSRKKSDASHSTIPIETAAQEVPANNEPVINSVRQEDEKSCLTEEDGQQGLQMVNMPEVVSLNSKNDVDIVSNAQAGASGSLSRRDKHHRKNVKSDAGNSIVSGNVATQDVPVDDKRVENSVKQDEKVHLTGEERKRDLQAINMPEVASMNNQSVADSSSVLRASQSGGLPRRERGHRKSAKSDVDNSIVSEQLVAQGDTVNKELAANTIRSEGEGSNCTEKHGHRNSAAVAKTPEMDSINQKNNENSLLKAQADQSVDRNNKNRSQQKSLKSNVSNSVASGVIEAQEVQVCEVPTASTLQHTESVSKRSSQQIERDRKSMSADVTHMINGKNEANKGLPHFSELTVDSLRRIAGDPHAEMGEGEPGHEMVYTDSSLFQTCISLPTEDARRSRRNRTTSNSYVDPHGRRRTPRKNRVSAIPPFQRRLLHDMEEKKRRDHNEIERSLGEYTFHPQTGTPEHGRLPRRRHTPAGGTRAQHYNSARAATPHVPYHRAVIMEEPLPTFKPEISKYARETQRSNIPYHERLYTPRAVSPQVEEWGGPLNGQSPQLSPRMMELIDGAYPPLFHPDISPRAKAIETNGPFYERLYPTKEELERRRHTEHDVQSPTTTPRRSPCRASHVSPRLLERPSPPANVVPYSFRPEISPRAMSIENPRPFYERLYPEKAELEQRHARGVSPPVSPRRSPRRVTQLSPRLLERAPPPPDTHPYSFHPEISPRAMSMERHGPVYERLYPSKEEREEHQRLQERYGLPPSFRPSITERGHRAFDNDGEVRKNVVRRLTERKESPQRPFDPSLTFHPFITLKAKSIRRGDTSSGSRTLF